MKYKHRAGGVGPEPRGRKASARSSVREARPAGGPVRSCGEQEPLGLQRGWGGRDTWPEWERAHQRLHRAEGREQAPASGPRPRAEGAATYRVKSTEHAAWRLAVA